MNGKCYVFSGYKQRNKVCLLYLERKLQQDRSVNKQARNSMQRLKSGSNKQNRSRVVRKLKENNE